MILNDQQVMDLLEKEGLNVNVFGDCLSDTVENAPDSHLLHCVNKALDQLGCGFFAIRVVSFDEDNGYTWEFESY